MRDTTKIKAIAEETIADLDAVKDGNVTQLRGSVADAIVNLRDIAATAKRMDARTGTSDPSVKAGGA